MATYAAKLKRSAIDGTTLRLNPDGTLSAGSMQPYGKIYYVDGNRLSTGDGTTWLKAMTTLSEALAASHANIALGGYEHRNWAGRNTIFVKADSITEDLELFADKTDVIGVGAQHSYDMPCIIGNHVPTNGMSTRFFNVQFRGDTTTGGTIMTIASTSQGIVFDGCYFNGWSATPAAIGVLATASDRMRIENCKFIGAFSTAAISIATGEANGTMINNNLIQSAAIGISVNSGFTTANEMSFINDNRIFSGTITIDDDSDKFKIMGNLGVSSGTIGANAYDFEGTNAAGNIISGSNTATTWPLAVNHG